MGNGREYSTPAGVVQLSYHHFLQTYDLSEVVFTDSAFYANPKIYYSGHSIPLVSERGVGFHISK